MNSVELWQGDCLELMKDIPDSSVDLTVTSPPYYNAKEYSHWGKYNDYLEFLERVFTLVFQKTKQGRMCCVNIGVVIQPRERRNSESTRIPIPFHFVGIMEKIGFKFLEDIIWVKPEGAAKNRNGRFSLDRQPIQYKPNVVNEYILVFQKPAPFLIDKIVRGYQGAVKEKSLIRGEYERSNIWHINPVSSNVHPAPYPLELCDKLIQYYSYVGDTVLDPFAGSGTTGVSCTKTGRNFIGIELDPQYYEIAQKQIYETTEQAVTI